MVIAHLASAKGNARKNAIVRFIRVSLFASAVGGGLGNTLIAEGIDSIPLNPPPAANGKTLFSELPPSETGIIATNRYDDPQMWGARFREYHVGAIGSGVAVGDYDGDGKPDIFVVSKVESGRLFHNLGNWRFEDVTDRAGLRDDSGAWKQGATWVDVNNDGLLDLYICRFNAPNLLYINQGNGIFKEEAAARGLAVVDACGMAYFADFDRDGWLDVYIQTNLLDAGGHPRGQRDYLFHNNGDGTFRDVTDSARILREGTQGHSAMWWDENEDGWPDLYVANDFEPHDVLYRNNHDGTFTNVIDQVVPHTPYSAMGSDSGDINNDGHIDLLVADMAGTTHEMNLRGLAAAPGQAGISQSENPNQAVQLYRNALYLNTGAGRCMEAASLSGLAATNWTWAVRIEDLDNDGKLDVFVTNGMDREQTNLDLIARRLNAVSPSEQIQIVKNSPVFKQANMAFANRGDLRFENVARQWGLDQVGVSFGAAFGDFNGDGNLDLVFTNYQQGPTFLRNNAQGNRVVIALRGTVSNRFGVGSRVEVTTKTGTQVRELELGRGYLSMSEPVVHFGLGEEKTISLLKIIWPSGRVQEFQDVAAGRRYTITEPKGDARPRPKLATRPPAQFENVTRLLDLGLTQHEEALEGTVPQPLLPRGFNRRGPGLAVGDLAGDGADEIVISATTRDAAKILRRDGVAFRRLALAPSAEKPPIDDGPPLIFDANGDGLNDLLFTGGGAALPAEDPDYEPRLWLNDGHGGFAPAPKGFMPSEPISVGAVVSADFDRDGKLDLFLGGRLLPGDFPEAATSALLLQRDGRMSDETDRFAPGLRELGLITSALATDVDGDGWIDLVVTAEWGGVHFFRNQAGHGLVDASAEWGFDTAGSGLWTSIAAADFNRDGRLDYVIGNLGLNTPYTASREHPLRLFAGDFAGSGKVQLVEAFDDNGKLVPVATRDQLGAKIPAVFQRFRSNDRFAASSLEEIFGKDALSKATEYRAGELRSGILLSQPSGKYVFEPLPHDAQIAPVQGMVASDFDGDGNTDILLVGNDYSPIASIGRFDGGLGWLLHGDGKGNFDPVPVLKSGWLVPGDAKALSMVDFDRDGWPDAMVSRNDDETLAFRNRGAGGARAIAVRLRGRGGNPDAIGARVTFESGGQALQMFEIHAGEGFASQSTSTVFLTVPSAPTAPMKIRIRWPSGATTVAEVPEKTGYLRIDQ